MIPVVLCETEFAAVNPRSSSGPHCRNEACTAATNGRTNSDCQYFDISSQPVVKKDAENATEGKDVPAKLLTPEDAKNQVLASGAWERLKRLAQRRFPSDPTLADEALTGLLEHLAADDWSRVCQWKGTSSLTGFVCSIATRYFTDFVRSRFGHTRPPQRIKEQARRDPLWLYGYEQFVVNSLSRVETRQLMHQKCPDRDWVDIDEILSAVIATGAKQPMFSEPTEPLDPLRDIERRPSTDSYDHDDAESQFEQEKVAADLFDGVIGDAVAPHIDLSSTDFLFLKLRYVENLGIQEIARRLHVNGDPYRHFHKLIGRLRDAYERSGLMPEQSTEDMS